MTEHEDEYDDKNGLAAELARAQQHSYVENLKMSLGGWRDMAGMAVNAAVAIDAVFLLLGAAVYTETTGTAALVGGLLIAIGAVGLLEKVVRRLW